jgi:hypothetical protein
VQRQWATAGMPVVVEVFEAAGIEAARVNRESPAQDMKAPAFDLAELDSYVQGPCRQEKSAPFIGIRVVNSL